MESGEVPGQVRNYGRGCAGDEGDRDGSAIDRGRGFERGPDAFDTEGDGACGRLFGGGGFR